MQLCSKSRDPHLAGGERMALSENTLQVMFYISVNLEISGRFELSYRIPSANLSARSLTVIAGTCINYLTGRFPPWNSAHQLWPEVTSTFPPHGTPHDSIRKCYFASAYLHQSSELVWGKHLGHVIHHCSGSKCF